MGNGDETNQHQSLSISDGGPLLSVLKTKLSWPVFLQQAAQTPVGIIHVQQNGTEYFQSYAELLVDATKVYSGLRALGAKLQDKVILQLNNTQDFVVCLWGCLLGGYVPVPLAVAPSYETGNSKSSQLLHTQQLCSSPFIIANQDTQGAIHAFFTHANQSSCRVVAVEQLQESPPTPVQNCHLGSPEDLALILMTSGSTGFPKGVMLSTENILVSASGMANVNGFSQTDITLNWMPIEHVASLVMFHFTAVFMGCQQIHVAHERILQKPLLWLDSMDQFQATVTWAPNFAYGLVNDCEAEMGPKDWDLSSIRWMGNGAEAVVGTTTRRFLSLLAPYGLGKTVVCPGYGMSETCSGIVHSHQFSLDLEETSFVEVGSPIPGVSIRIVEESDHLLPEGQIGQLQVKGLTVTSGYYQRPELNQELFTEDGWLRTGDLGFIRQGRLTITGRQKDVIVIQGVTYYSHEIETVVETIDDVENSYTAACAVRHLHQTTEQLAIFFHSPVVQDQELINLLRQIRKTVILRIGVNPDYLIPVAPTEIPKTAIGKIQHPQLVQNFQRGDFDAIRHRMDTLLNSQDLRGQMPQSDLEKQLAAIWQDVLKQKQVGINDNFFELGGTSLLLIQVLHQISSSLDIELAVVELFQYPTIQSLARFLSNTESEATAIYQAQQRGQARRRSQAQQTDIAVIGIGCRFPGANTIDQFWQNLCDGVESITFFNDDEILASGVDPHQLRQESYVKASPILGDIESFDANFFGYSPKEAELMDPQQRLLLECAWEGLENAGYEPLAYKGAIALYAGCSMNTYLLNHVYPNRHHIDPQDASAVFTLNSLSGFQMTVANDKDYLTTKVSYKLNLKGPSVNVQTACSTSLVAIHLASQSLLNQECDLALAGGVSVHTPQRVGYRYQEGMILSPDGHCRAFDSQAQGTLFGSGAGIVVLKRLEAALTDRDHIYAVIKGSAIGNDGGQKVGYLAPQAEGQAVVVAEAMAAANVSAKTIGYIEAHGTGTELGDPIEIAALTQAFRVETQQRQFCALGSVKTNVGHLNIASGIVGFIKTVLALRYQQLPPSLHFETPNPQINFEQSPFYVNTNLSDWPRTPDRRRAAVNSLGIGGTNAHIILEEAIQPKQADPPEPDRPVHLLTLSAKTLEGLHALADRYVDFLTRPPQSALADICFTANAGRSHFQHRLTVLTQSREDLKDQLHHWLSQQTSCCRTGKVSERANSAKLAMLFTGQGCQFPHMGRQLYETQPTFRQALQDCDDILSQYLDRSLLSVLYPGVDPDHQVGPSDSASRLISGSTLLDQTAYTQPALFAFEYALYRLWLSWGIQPTVVMGHSVGEYVAAYVAGVFSLEDGLKLIAARGKLMQAVSTSGSMVSVQADQQTVKAAIDRYPDTLAIAAINGPQSIVISGTQPDLDQVVVTLNAQGIKTAPLQVSHAFHSPLMETVLPEFAEIAQQISYAPPRMEIISNLTGISIAEEIATPAYWCQHLRQPVQFAASMTTLIQSGYDVFLECSPKPILLGLGRSLVEDQALVTPKSPLADSDRHQHLEKAESDNRSQHTSVHTPLWLPSLRPNQEDWPTLLQSLETLYLRGVPINWLGFDQDYCRSRVPLPTYPFQRQRFWIDPPSAPIALSTVANNHQKSGHPLLGRRLSTALQQILFQSQIAPHQPAFLQEHQVLSQVVVPGSAYFEMALAAGNQSLTAPFALEQVVIEQALLLSHSAPTSVQVILERAPRGMTFKIYSFVPRTHDSGEEDWRCHCTGNLVVIDQHPTPPPVALAELCRRLSPGPPVADFYQTCVDRGLNYGSSFQALQQLWVGDQEALAQLQLPASLNSEWANYHLHPALLDACCQVIFAALPAQDQASLYLPIGLESLTVYHPPSSCLWSYVQVRSGSKEKERGAIATVDISILDNTGHRIASLTGLSAKLVGPQIFLNLVQPQHNWLYQVEWHLHPLNTQPPQLQQGRWLIFTDQDGLAHQLETYLASHNQTCTLVRPGDQYQVTEQQIQLNPDHLHDFCRLLETVTADTLPLLGIIHLWSVDIPPTSDLTATHIEEASRLGCGSVLLLIQALSKTKWVEPPRLWFVTKGAQSVNEKGLPGLAQAPLWGMAKVIAQECPEFQGITLDLDPDASHCQAHQLFQEIWGRADEHQIALRSNQRYVARLVHFSGAADPASEDEVIPVPHYLDLSDRGSLEYLQWQPLSRRLPQADEVEIQVQATGLNFRDVLNTLGLYPGNPGPLGLECAGNIVAIGANVKHFQVGEPVMAIAPGCFSDYVTVNIAQVASIPASLSLTEAVTVPVAFVTANYALNHLAHIGAQDRILIHSAAGGVGQAALQVAQQAGAEIFATASPQKWDFLKSLGIKHVMNSRSLDFVDQVMSLTQGQGVTIVLNCLTGEFIPHSLSLLSPQGHFLEMGKQDIWTPAQVRQRRPDLCYSIIDLIQTMNQNPQQIQTLLSEVSHYFHDLGEEQATLGYHPLPHTVFTAEQVVNAFRYMQQAKHIGKVVVAHSHASQSQGHPHRTASQLGPRHSQEERLTCRQDGTYLITGGTGGLGLQIARWLIAKGAKHLILISRTGSTRQLAPQLQALQEAGAHIQVVAADVSIKSELEAVITALAVPVRGIIHAAGILNDGILIEQTWQQFQEVLAPKTIGAWHLHQLTREHELDFFVMFSSAASLLGSAGQASYAAANAFLDALAHTRKTMNLPGLSINWGPWSHLGLADQAKVRQRMHLEGMEAISLQTGLATLEQLILQSSPQVGVIPLDWTQWHAQKGASPFWDDLIPPTMDNAVANRPSLLHSLEVASAEERQLILMDYIKFEVSKLLGIHPSALADPKVGLTEVGMDSLSIVELRNNLQIALDCPLSSTLIYDHPTLSQLTEQLLGRIFPTPITAPSPEPSQSKPSDDEGRTVDIQELSAAEVEALLLQKLEDLND